MLQASANAQDYSQDQRVCFATNTLFPGSWPMVFTQLANPSGLHDSLFHAFPRKVSCEPHSPAISDERRRNLEPILWQSTEIFSCSTLTPLVNQVDRTSVLAVAKEHMCMSLWSIISHFYQLPLLILLLILQLLLLLLQLLQLLRFIR